MPTICLLGRQPAIGLAELESLYGAERVHPLGTSAVLVDGEIDFDRLGGSVKAAKHLTTIDTTDPLRVFDYCRQTLPQHLAYIPEGKIKLGVSLYGMTLAVHDINTQVLKLKSVIKRAGRSARAIPNSEPALSSAQSYHGRVTSPVGLELVFVSDGSRTYLGHVTHVQDIDRYTLRDRGRPKRDAFVGMLPPKLAQVIVNLAIGRGKMEDGIAQNANSHIPHASSHVILDPFCGTGVILQEAALMGYGVYGTDISEKMVRYTRDNINWLFDTLHIHTSVRYEIADATNHQWDFSSLFPLPTSLYIATESYLGQPIGGQKPTPEKLREIIHDSNSIMRGFLKNIAPQLPSGTRLCVAAPAWYIDGAMHHLPVLDELDSLGFARVQFSHATFDQLIYRRDDQPTGRELLVLTTK